MKRRENIEGESGSEYLVPEREHFLPGGVVDFTQPLYEACFVHGADLVQDDLSGFSLESDSNPRWILSALRGHGSNDHGADMSVHLVGRDDNAGSGFADFAAFGGIKANDLNLESGYYHRHSVLSHFVDASESRSSSASSPFSAILRNASSQPRRGLVAERTTRWSLCASISTVSSRRHSSKNLLGMRMPRELPMRTTLVFMILSFESRGGY